MSATSSSAPLVTIGVPAYNSERHLRTSLDSLLAQTYRDFVLVISDNASTDSTADICQEYVRKDPRVKYFRNPVNVGMTGNFNRVFELTHTKYIKWSTADDFWAPEMLADAVAVMEADPSIAVCYPQTIIVNDEGREQGPYYDQLHLMQDDPAERFSLLVDRIKLVNHHLGLLRTDAVRRTRLFGKHVSADIGFLAEMSLYGKFYEVKKPQFFRRFHIDSSSWNRAAGDEEQEARRFHAANVRRVPFQSFRYHAWFMRAILRSPLSLIKKCKLLLQIGRTMFWHRRFLYDDLRRDVPAALGLGKKSTNPSPNRSENKSIAV
jgi:glycosyltransferase involved in cell wall biosynthesis